MTREAVEVETVIARVVDASPVGMLVIDDQGFIVFANREAERIFGYAAKQLEGLRLEHLISPASGDRHVLLRKPHPTEPQTLQAGAARHLLARRRNGSEFPVEVGLNPVKVDSGRLVLASIVDVTDRLKAVSFESLISEISARFVNLPPEALDEAIVDALHQIVDALDLDRAAVWLRDEDNDDFYPAQRWARDGVAVTADRLSVRESFPWHWQRIMAGDVAVYSRVSDIPDEATRASVVRYGAAAGATIGFSIKGVVAGMRHVCNH